MNTDLIIIIIGCLVLGIVYAVHRLSLGKEVNVFSRSYWSNWNHSVKHELRYGHLEAVMLSPYGRKRLKRKLKEYRRQNPNVPYRDALNTVLTVLHEEQQRVRAGVIDIVDPPNYGAREIAMGRGMSARTNCRRSPTVGGRGGH